MSTQEANDDIKQNGFFCINFVFTLLEASK